MSPAAVATLWKYSKPQAPHSQRLPSRKAGSPAPQEGQNLKKADLSRLRSIIQESKRVLIGARTGDPRELQTQIGVQVNWTDNRGKMLRSCPDIPLPATLTESSGNLVPEVGQSLAVAQQDAINRLAEQIVGMMEIPW